MCNNSDVHSCFAEKPGWQVAARSDEESEGIKRSAAGAGRWFNQSTTGLGWWWRDLCRVSEANECHRSLQVRTLLRSVSGLH